MEFTSPGDHDHGGPVGDEDLLEGDQNLAGLLAMRARTDSQRVIGHRKAKVLEDLLGHPAVIVLARVDHDLVRCAAVIERLDERGHLYEIRPGAHHVHDRIYIGN